MQSVSDDDVRERLLEKPRSKDTYSKNNFKTMENHEKQRTNDVTRARRTSGQLATGGVL